MKRICAVMIGLALLVVTPGLATADSTHQQAINVVIQRALSQRGVPYAYGGGNIAGPSLGTAAVDTPVGAAAPVSALIRCTVTSAPLASTSALSLLLRRTSGHAGSDSIRPGWSLRIRRRRDQDAAVVGRAVQGRPESAAVASVARRLDLLRHRWQPKCRALHRQRADGGGHRSCRHGVAGTYFGMTPYLTRIIG